MTFSRYLYKQFLKKILQRSQKKIKCLNNIYRSNIELKDNIDKNMVILEKEIKNDLCNFKCDLKKKTKKLKDSTNYLFNMIKENT